MMELPAVIGFLMGFIEGPIAAEPVPLFVGSLWFLHYLPRTFLYSWFLRSSTPFPLLLLGVGGAFNLINSVLNGFAVSHLSLFLRDTWVQDPRFILGTITFFLGMSINLHADHVLRRLRQPGDSSYYVPYGGVFRWVSCPNYLGELIEWMGWGLLSWSWAGLAFVVFSCANLIPRALQHHRWYHATFAEYPQSRKAIFPWVL
jgi:protein-S-isoprenylcysteine O-methyltransferase Ste14